MPAIVLAPPIIIDGTSPARDDFNGSHYFGPFVIGANLYAVLASNLPAGPGTRFLNVYKSTNNGLAWTNLDTANRPILNSGSQEFDVILNGSVLKIVYVVPGVNHVARIVTFDTGTDTFGAVSADGPIAHSVKLVQFASGDVCVWYNQLTLGLCAAVIFSGGVWGAATTIPNGKNNVATAVLGANDVAQLFYYDTNAPGFNLFYRTFTNPGVMGAEQAVLSSAFLANQNENSVPVGRISIWNGNFKAPYYDANGHAAIFTGAPYTAPVWDAGVLVDTLTWGVNEQDSDGFTLVDANNNLILFWNSEDTGNVVPVDQMYYAINSGSGFAAPVLFYDAVANPQLQDPAQTPASQFLHTLSAVRFTNGNFGVITAMEENGFCAGYYLSGAGGVSCPKNAQGV